jgi:hypothetical protein
MHVVRTKCRAHSKLIAMSAPHMSRNSKSQRAASLRCRLIAGTEERLYIHHTIIRVSDEVEVEALNFLSCELYEMALKPLHLFSKLLN